MTARKRKEDLLPAGRPTTYSDELAERICFLVSTHTVGLTRLTKMYDDLPAESTIRLWRAKDPKFSTRYAQAKLFQAELLAEECLDIADDSRNDWMESLGDNEKGALRVNAEAINRSRLRIDTRKFLAAKLLPKKYGDIKDLFDESNKALHEEIMERQKALYELHKKDY